MQENFAQLVVEFDSLLVEKTTLHPKYDLVTATSSAGGLLGLLIGGSVVTFLEVLELLILFLNTFVNQFQCR